jgi:hypothetical protein
LTNRLLILCFAVALVINVGYTLIGLASIPAYYERTTTQTVEPYVIANQTVVSNASVAKEAAERGMSLSSYATYKIVLDCVLALVPLTVAALVTWRARRQWFAWYTAFIIVFLGGYALAEQVYVAQLISLRWYDAGAIFWFLLLSYLYLFPNGKPVPRRALWIVGGLALYHFIIQVVAVLVSFAPEGAASLPVDWKVLGSVLFLPLGLNCFILGNFGRRSGLRSVQRSLFNRLSCLCPGHGEMLRLLKQTGEDDHQEEKASHVVSTRSCGMVGTPLAG